MDSSTEVKIIQKWNGLRPKINFVLAEFYAYLVQQKLMEIKKHKQLDKDRQKYGFLSTDGNNPNQIAWIEKLLHTPVEDYRKNVIALVLAPDFINVRKCSYEESFNVIKDWVDKCNSVKQLDSNFNYLINHAIQNAMKNGYRPLKLENLKPRNTHLYNLLISGQTSYDQ